MLRYFDVMQRMATETPSETEQIMLESEILNFCKSYCCAENTQDIRGQGPYGSVAKCSYLSGEVHVRLASGYVTAECLCHIYSIDLMQKHKSNLSGRVEVTVRFHLYQYCSFVIFFSIGIMYLIKKQVVPDSVACSCYSLSDTYLINTACQH